MDPKENGLYRSARSLPSALWDDLALRDSAEAAGGAGGIWEGSMFRLDLLGQEYGLNPKKREITHRDRPDREVDFETGMVLLIALAKGLDIPPSQRMVIPRELPGGAMFFAGPHEVAAGRLAERFGKDAGPLLAKAGPLGGRAFDLGDAGIVVPGLPRIPLYAAVWEETDEDPARALVGIDDRAHLHLPLDAVWGLTNLFIARLLEA